jgi:hypothetical protein
MQIATVEAGCAAICTRPGLPGFTGLPTIGEAGQRV